jgi:sigma-B regulation protein RsbU (phosphoserine phosphatase)
LRNESNARARIESELQVAHTIQSSSLPDIATAFPPQTAFDLHAAMDPAREVGGDFFDFFLVNPDTLFVAVGDVAGKGVPSALFMMTVRAMVKAEAMRGLPPSEVLRRVNLILCQGNATAMFVTILCAMVNIDTGHVLFGNAGHCPPLVRLGAEGFRYLELPPSPVVGVRPAASFSSASLTLRRGDILFFYTDGVTEAIDAAGAFYDEPRLLESARRLDPPSMEALVAAVRSDVARFAQGAVQSDDITMLALRFLGGRAATPVAGGEPATATETDMAHCSLPARIESMPAFHAAAACCANMLGFPQERMADIELAVEEVLANIISHAYQASKGTIELRCSCDDRRLVLQFIDGGIPFDVTAAPVPKLPSDISRRDIGGLGIHLVKQLMDEVTYRRENERNILTLSVSRPDSMPAGAHE